jgi:hypothetical protein
MDTERIFNHPYTLQNKTKQNKNLGYIDWKNKNFPSTFQNCFMKLDVVIHTYNPSSQEAETGRSWVWGQPGLYKHCFKKKKKKKDQKA